MKSVGVSKNRYNSQLQKSRSNDWPKYFDRSPPLKTFIFVRFLSRGKRYPREGTSNPPNWYFSGADVHVYFVPVTINLICVIRICNRIVYCQNFPNYILNT